MLVVVLTFMIYLTYNAFLCEGNHPLLSYLGLIILLHTFLVTFRNLNCIESISRQMSYRELFKVDMKWFVPLTPQEKVKMGVLLSKEEKESIGLVK